MPAMEIGGGSVLIWIAFIVVVLWSLGIEIWILRRRRSFNYPVITAASALILTLAFLALYVEADGLPLRWVLFLIILLLISTVSSFLVLRKLSKAYEKRDTG